MIRKFTFNQKYPQEFMPVIEVNLRSTAQGEILLNDPDIEEITTLTGKVYLATPPDSSNDNWLTSGNDLFTTDILDLNYQKLSTGLIKIKWRFDPSPISGETDDQYYAIFIDVNAAEDAGIAQAGIEMIMKLNNFIEIGS